MFEKLIVVACTPEQQIARAVHRDGSTEEEARARLRRQMPVEEKLRYADFVIDTSGPKEQTVEQTRAVYEKLRSFRNENCERSCSPSCWWGASFG